MTGITPEQLKLARAKLARDARHDPLLFAEKAWPWGVDGTALAGSRLRAWQTEVLDETATHLGDPETRHRVLRIAIASGHGVGKSALTGILTTWGLSCYRDPRILLTANTEPQLRTKTSPEVGQWVRNSMFGDLFDTDTLSIRAKHAPEQHRADLQPNTEHRPEAFAGLHAQGRMVMVLMDEASGIPDVIAETVEGALTDEETVLIWIAMGNPTQNKGFFREAFRRDRRYWKTWKIDNRTVEGVNQEEQQALIERFGYESDRVRVRVRGEFPSQSSRQFIASDVVDRAYGRHLRRDAFEHAPVILSCDPAWTGDDDLVIGKRQGLHFDILEVMERNDDDVLVASKLAHYEAKHEADAVFIDAGYGTGIASIGHHMGRDWQLVWFGSAPSDPGCYDKRSEMWLAAREWLQSGGAIPRDDNLYHDLIHPETKGDLHGRVRLQSKDDMRRGGYPSPDRADALALTFAMPVTKRNYPPGSLIRHHQERGQSRSRTLNEVYDPEAYR